MRLLVVEDEQDLQGIIKKRLVRENYSVDACGDGREALDYLAVSPYDAVILDIMLPGMSGIEVLKRIRAEGNHVPVLFLTARDGVGDRVAGLDWGADDYLVKPFAFEELLARIRVMLRRRSEIPADELVLANLKVDVRSHTVFRNGEKLELSGKEFAVLEYLMRNQGRVLSREQIEQHVWNFDYEGASNMVDVYIRYLRRKIDEGYDRKLIHTVRGAGYVMREQP
ncbi:MAG: response regulator transcription factor [Clostridiales bacterium]|nr:response regulator transcription factor [Clostridiales bacterium]